MLKIISVRQRRALLLLALGEFDEVLFRAPADEVRRLQCQVEMLAVHDRCTVSKSTRLTANGSADAKPVLLPGSLA